MRGIADCKTVGQHCSQGLTSGSACQIQQHYQGLQAMLRVCNDAICRGSFRAHSCGVTLAQLGLVVHSLTSMEVSWNAAARCCNGSIASGGNNEHREHACSVRSGISVLLDHRGDKVLSCPLKGNAGPRAYTCANLRFGQRASLAGSPG